MWADALVWLAYAIAAVVLVRAIGRDRSGGPEA